MTSLSQLVANWLLSQILSIDIGETMNDKTDSKKLDDPKQKEQEETLEDYLPMFEVTLDDFEEYKNRTCEICLCAAPLTPCEMNDTGTDVILLCQACAMSPIGDILFRNADYNANLVKIADLLAHVTNIIINNIKVLEDRLEGIETNMDLMECHMHDQEGSRIIT